MSTVPRPEYPRPQFRRQDWTNLNGEWRFAFDDGEVGLAQGWQNVTAAGLEGSHFDRSITVPFSYQSRLSGIGETAQGARSRSTGADVMLPPMMAPGGTPCPRTTSCTHARS